MYKRFTLTMWDVKEMELYERVLTNLGFTLTMWDVKQMKKN